MAIKCPSCGNDNPDDALYCGVCQNIFRKEGGTARPVAAAAPQPASPSSGADDADLGALLFERQAHLLLRLLWSLIAGLLTAGSLAALAYPEIERTGPLIGLGLGVLLVLAAAHAWASLLRCYERGVQHRGLRGTVTLRYEDIGSFTWSATRQYTNGVYTSTNFLFEFVPRPGIRKRSIRFTAVKRDEDPALNELRDQVSRMLANRLSEEFQRTGKAAWTPNLRLLRNAVEYRASGLLGQADPVLIPWDRMRRWSVDEGVFKVWVQGSEDPAISENVSEPNFFPGLLVFGSVKG